MVSLVGIRSALKMRQTQTEVTAALSRAVVDPSTLPIASPWSSSNLQRVVFEDIFGSDLPVNTRSAAMKLSALSSARNQVVSSIAKLPLVAKKLDAPLPVQPSWIWSAIDGTSPQHRMAWTVDDLIFYGYSCWWRDNDAATRFPLAVRRLNQGTWSVNADNKVEINGQVVPDANVILFSGFHEGILSYGTDTLEDARDLYKIIRSRLKNPIPGLELHQTGGDDMDQDEIDLLIDRWAAARQGARMGVGFTNEFIQLNELGKDGDAQLMIEARNATAVELARLVGVAAGQVDATAPKASLNYETQTGRNQEFVDFALALYMTPIAARLSLDDITPHGTNVDFDRTDLTAPAPSPTGPTLED